MPEPENQRSRDLGDRISRRRREHLEQLVGTDPGEIAGNIVDGVLITASMTDPDPGRRAAARQLLDRRHPASTPHEPADLPEPVRGLRQGGRPGVVVTGAVSGGGDPGQDRHSVEFDATGDEQCWGSRADGGACPRRAETEVGLCEECLIRIQDRIDRG